MPNIYVADDTFAQYVAAEGDLDAAKERMKETLESNAPGGDDA